MSEELQTIVPEASIEDGINEKFNAWSGRINKINSEILANGDVKEFPEWWLEDLGQVQEIKSELKQGANPQDVSNYFDLCKREAEVVTKVTGRQTDRLFNSVIVDLGPDVIGSAFVSETEEGPFHQAMLESLTQKAAEGKDYSTIELEVLQKAYGLDKITKILGIKGGDFENKLHDLLLNEKVASLLRFKDLPQKEEYLENKDRQETYRDWMAEALESAADISHDEAMDYTLSASRRRMEGYVIDIIKQFDHFGVDRIRRITKATGIVGLEAYSIEQLERMDAFASNPDLYAETLKNHDVNVLMVNRVGDDNGVMKETATEFDDSTSARTLFFEIASASDILKNMAVLNKHNIKPSSLILSIHSAPGMLVVSDERNKDIKRQNKITISGNKMVDAFNAGDYHGEKVYSMHGMKGVARAIESYMQPSRAIDDDSSSEGRKKIIFQACYAGAETEQRDFNANGEKVQIGTESVISQFAKDLLDSGVESNIDIYGAPAAIKIQKTSNGVRYTGAPLEFGSSRSAVRAVHINIDGGTLAKNDIDEIILRKNVA